MEFCFVEHHLLSQFSKWTILKTLITFCRQYGGGVNFPHLNMFCSMRIAEHTPNQPEVRRLWNLNVVCAAVCILLNDLRLKGYGSLYMQIKFFLM